MAIAQCSISHLDVLLGRCCCNMPALVWHTARAQQAVPLLLNDL
jgi:hypothetical protein